MSAVGPRTEGARRIDHDQRFKLLVKEFIREFFELFLPTYAPLFNFSRVEWLETEVFPDPPQGRRRVLDIVGRLPLFEPLRTGADTWTTDLVAIIHVEIESADSVQPLRTTMFQNFTCLRQKYAEPILPVALYLSVGLDGIGIDHYEERFGPLDVLVTITCTLDCRRSMRKCTCSGRIGWAWR